MEPLPAPEEIARLPRDGGSEFNRLIHEKSPYLLQHARNPVDWYPWGEEALTYARVQDKPIFLSVGYSTCHWCHVMEHESFENSDVARLLNDLYIPIKVDREERPDLDEIYMKATQLFTQRGGWPNSLWLTPAGMPWFAGTYFPREDVHGRAGFKSLLKRLSEFWHQQRSQAEEQAESLAGAMRQMVSASPSHGVAILERNLVERLFSELRDHFDKQHGGFGGAPKFPPHGGLKLLLSEVRRSGREDLLELATATLDAMALGGIRDHVGGGFHRYSTDQRWLLPHFEKMLYDNAQLGRVYVEAFLITGEERYRQVAVSTFDWVLEEMTSPEGGYYSAQDADSEGEEGKFYLWTREQILEELGEESGEAFCSVYQIEARGNFLDEATGTATGTNIPHLVKPHDDPHEEAELHRNLRALYKVRAERVPPHLDDKVLASWNGLMMGSLAYAGKELHEPRYLEAARRAADFVLCDMVAKGRLLRSYREGGAHLNGYLDDYAFLADGLLDVHEASGDPRYLNEARQLVEVMLKHFQVPGGGFYFTSDDHEQLLVRSQDPYDQAIPSGNGVAAQVLLRLWKLCDHAAYREAAHSTLKAFAQTMVKSPRGTEALILATMAYLDETVPSEGGRVSASADWQTRRGPAQIRAYASALLVAPGEEFLLAVAIDVEEGWHLETKPGVDLELQPGSLFEAGMSPPPDESGSLWRLGLKVSEDAPSGPALLSLRVHYQVCGPDRCLKPESLDFSLPILVEPRDSKAPHRYPEIFGQG
ncbi:MAG: thioredoxin domain-containing protein [Planctomycetota bacterium]